VVTQQFDAVVVGGGIAGAASAYYLRRQGLSVALIEQHAPAWGASGRNPGFLWLQTKAAGTAMEFSLAGRRIVETLAGELPDFGFRACGGLITYRDEAFAEAARAFVADRAQAGLSLKLLDREELHSLCPQIGPQVSGAVWNPLDAHQDTPLLVRRLVAAFSDAGGRLIAPARVTAIEVEKGRCRGVRLAGGDVLACATVVVACGPWSNELLAPHGLGVPFQWTRFEAASTGAAPFRIGRVVAGQSLFRFFTPPGMDAAAFPRDPSEQIRPALGFTEQIASMPDGSIQFGCAYEIGSSHDQPTVAGQAMACSIMSRNFPALSELPITRQWAGLVAQTPDGLPVIDAACGIEGLMLNTGHFFGNLAGAFSGKLLAEAATRSDASYDITPFALSRFTGRGHAVRPRLSLAVFHHKSG
jgi:glycine/D-amino acid oxidase-like deaminating enzyme